MSRTQAENVNREVRKVDVGGKRTTETEVELAEKLNELIEKFNQLQRRTNANAE
jgi:hypothetical protein